MTAPLRPFGRFVSRLSVGKKLMLIYLLDLTAVIYVSGILINEKFIAIDFARKEVDGNAYIAALRAPLLDVAAAAAGDVPARARLSGHAGTLAAAEAQFGAAMASAATAQGFASALARLSPGSSAGAGAGASAGGGAGAASSDSDSNSALARGRNRT